MTIKLWFVALGGAAFTLAPLAATAQTPERAVSAARFINSIGINAHWGYGGSRYADHYPQVKRLLIESGIRHVRGDLTRTGPGRIGHQDDGGGRH